MRPSAWRLAAASLATVGFLSPDASGQVGPVVRVAPASRGPTRPSVSVSPNYPNDQTANLKRQLKDTEDRLHAYEA